MFDFTHGREARRNDITQEISHYTNTDCLCIACALKLITGYVHMISNRSINTINSAKSRYRYTH
eukprot:4062585-Amphidinium_carterae.1